MEEAELREIRRIAKRERMSVSEWVRGAMRAARARVPENAIARKVSAIRAALEHAYPTADIDVMLNDIERGYRDEAPR